MAKAKTTAHKGPCFQCGAPCTDDNFCFGCKAFICDGCDKAIMLMGQHEKEQHLEDDIT